MSRENVELARTWYSRANRAVQEGRDLTPAIRDFFDPGIVMEMGVIEGTIHGHDGVKRFFEEQATMIDGMHFEATEFIDSGERLVVPHSMGGTARHSGLPIHYTYVHVITMRRGKAIHVRLYSNLDKALRALA